MKKCTKHVPLAGSSTLVKYDALKDDGRQVQILAALCRKCGRAFEYLGTLAKRRAAARQLPDDRLTRAELSARRMEEQLVDRRVDELAAAGDSDEAAVRRALLEASHRVEKRPEFQLDA